MRAGLSGDGVRGRKLWALCFALLVSPARLGLAAAGDGWPHEQVGRSRSSVLFCFSSIHVRVRSRGCAIRGRACLAHLPASGQQPSTAGADPAPAITYAVVRKGERVPQGVTTCFQGRASGDEGHYSGGPRWLRVGGALHALWSAVARSLRRWSSTSSFHGHTLVALAERPTPHGRHQRRP